MSRGNKVTCRTFGTPTIFGVWTSVEPNPSSVERKPAIDAAAIDQPARIRGWCNDTAA